jgi:hypothetical protein
LHAAGQKVGGEGKEAHRSEEPIGAARSAWWLEQVRKACEGTEKHGRRINKVEIPVSRSFKDIDEGGIVGWCEDVGGCKMERTWEKFERSPQT